MTSATHAHPDSKLEYFVEYYPNECGDGEGAFFPCEIAFKELTQVEFESLIKAHKARGVAPVLNYDTFSVFENGRNGQRLTILDEYGVFYG